MPNLVGIGNEQVPTNSMLGGLAYQDPANANLTEVEIENIAKVRSHILDDANDIFIYDTRKDSDGGAWRKRCQHTSWYNERLGTAQRGTRKEFPAVAVIVSWNHGFTIYDGDDPNMPMWMNIWQYVNNSSGSTLIWGGSGTGGKVIAKNGVLYCSTTTVGTRNVHFINDRMSLFYNSIGNYTQTGGVAQRNEPSSDHAWSASDKYYGLLLGAPVYDMSIIVEPNSPIDPETGLPEATIAVATDRAVNILRLPSGRRIVSAEDSSYDVDEIELTYDSEDGEIGVLASLDNNADSNSGIVFDTIASIKSKPYATFTNWDKVWYWNNYNAKVSTIAGSGTAAVVPIQQLKGKDFVVGTTKGLNLITRNPNSIDDNKSLTARITKDFCSGYMHKSIKGAYLAEIDDTAHTGNQVTNGSFATVSDGQDGYDNSDGTVDGWGSNANSSLSINGNALRFTHTNSGSWQGGNANYAMGGNFVVGKTYSVKYRIRSSGNGNYSQGVGARIQKGSSWHSSNTEFSKDSNSDPGTSWTTKYWTWTATQTNYGIEFYNWYGVQNSWIEIDDIEVKEVVADRSYNNDGSNRTNKGGLYISGTVTKTKVAEGSDLVYYSGFSSNNYLIQQPDTRLDFGTGDLYIMYWVNFTQNNAYDNIMGRRYHDGSNYSGNGWFLEMGANNNVTLKDSATGQSRAALDGDSAFGVWQHHCFMRVNGKGHSFRNGVRTNNTYTWTENLTNTNATFIIGRTTHGNDDADKTKIALVRLGADELTEKQLKKIYLEEKRLFEPNAKCTLYGTSDTITAMAYDDSTEILHVGTSSGRSDFRGLTRINNTTTAVTTAISASNGLIAEQ